MSSSNALVQRRNGKVSACEPCRKRKLACDNGLPVCARCIKRKQTRECQYHPSPLTKTKAPSRERTTSTTSRRPLLSPPSESRSTPFANTASPGFVGESSSSAVIDELNSTLGIETTAPSASGYSSSYAPTNTPAQDLRARGKVVLQSLQHIETFKLYVNRWLVIGRGRIIYEPIYTLWLESIETLVRAGYLDGSNGLAFDLLSERVWQSTKRPLMASGDTTAQEWAQQSAGESLRWETIGLLYTTIGLLMRCISSWDETLCIEGHISQDRNEISDTALHFANECISLTKSTGQVSDLLAVLLYEQSLFLEVTRGDTSPESWLRMGEVCDTAILLGLHKEKRPDSSTPFFLCEMRIRLFDQIYAHDKWLSTFLGRPPRLTYRHSAVQTPHDLSDEDCCLSGPALQAALGKIDNGLALSGPLHRSTWRRVWGPQLIIREDILEIALAFNKTDLQHKIDAVRAKIEDSVQTLPSFAAVDPVPLMESIEYNIPGEVPGRGVPWRPLDVMSLVVVQCITLHTNFLLERAIVAQRKQTTSSGLIECAQKLLTLVIVTLAKRDTFRDFQSDFCVLLTTYGIPSAGVLAMEILKRDRFGGHTASLSRSQTIQQLCILVNELGTVRPGDGNIRMAHLGRAALRKFLDTLLSPPPERQLPPSHFGSDFMAEDNNPFLLNNDADLLSWLNEFDSDDWLHPS